MVSISFEAGLIMLSKLESKNHGCVYNIILHQEGIVSDQFDNDYFEASLDKPLIANSLSELSSLTVHETVLTCQSSAYQDFLNGSK